MKALHRAEIAFHWSDQTTQGNLPKLGGFLEVGARRAALARQRVSLVSRVRRSSAPRRPTRGGRAVNDVVDDVITRALAGDLDALEAVREAVRGSISSKSRKRIRNKSPQCWCDKFLPPEIVDIRVKVRKLHPALANYARETK